MLVTGGAGYIGSHACKALWQSGYIPVTLDNLSKGWRQAVKFGPFEYVDLRNRSDIDHVLQKYSPIAIMHFAAKSEVGESVQRPELYWENNVVGALNLIQSAIKNNCMNFVFSSTCAVYGDQDKVVLDELSAQNPTNPYGASKITIENILADFDKAYGLKHVIFRYFNVAGADSEAEVGEFHLPETHLIPLILEVADGKRDSLTIFGTDYDTPDGTCIRDYVHVCDLVDAHLSGLRWLESRNDSRIFNLGTGKGFSVLEVIDHVEKITNCTVAIKKGLRRAGDCEKLVSGSSRAVSDLGWNPDRSNLDQIIEDAWRWHKKDKYSE